MELTVDAGAVDGDSSNMADKDCEPNASRGKNRKMGCALRPSLVGGSKHHKDEEKSENGLH